MPSSDSDLIDSVIRANELEDDVRLFRSSNEETWYIDRHVLEVGTWLSLELHEW